MEQNTMAVREQQWLETIEAAKQSGLPVNQWCREKHIYLACGYTDLRRGIDGLAQLVQQQFSLDPFSNSLFLFCGRRRDRIKALLWEGDVLYKRIEHGGFQWPRTAQEMRNLSWQEFRWLLKGLSVDQPKSNKLVFRCVL